MPRVALQQDKSQVIGLVVIEPSGSHDRVRMTAGPDQPLRAALPVMGLGGAVVGAGAVGDADRRHQGDARRPGAKSDQDVAYSAVVDGLSPGLAGTIRAKGEHDAV